MPSTSTIDLVKKLDRLNVDTDLLNKFVHGTEQEDVILGDPPVATPSIRKMVFTIDQRESHAAQEVISGAILAIDTRTAEKIVEITDEAAKQLGDIESKGLFYGNSIENSGNSYLSRITTSGAGQLLQITTTGNEVLTTLSTIGAEEKDKLQNTGSNERLNIIIEGDTQVTRVRTEGALYLAQGQAQVDASANSAQEAKDSADRAVDMTHVGPMSKNNFGFGRAGRNIQVDPDGTFHVDMPTVVSTPAVDFPTIIGIGFKYIASFSAETAVHGATIKEFVVTFGDNPPVIVPATNNQGTIELTPSGASGKVGRLAVGARDSVGNVSLDSIQTYTQNTVEIQAPRILFPVNSDSDISLTPTILAQTPTIAGVPGTPQYSHFQVATDELFSDIIADSTDTYLTNSQFVILSRLGKLTKYYVRARHSFVQYGWSAWGAVSFFTTMDAFVNKPTVVSPNDSAIEVSLQPTVLVSAFSNTGPADTAEASEIQVATDNLFANIVAQHTGAYTASFAVPIELTIVTDYYIRARHKGTIWGWSAWSTTTTFTTLNAYTNQVIITSPTNNATAVSRTPTIAIQAHSNVGPTDTPTGTQVQISKNAVFTDLAASYNSAYTRTYTPSAPLEILYKYYVRARHNGAKWGWGLWSTTVVFTTLDVHVNKPTMKSPANGAIDIDLRPLLEMNAVTAVNESVVGYKYEVATDAAFMAMVLQSAESATLSYQMTFDLTIDTTYYIRPWAKGSITGWTMGAVATVRTINAYVEKPTITAPANNATGQLQRPVIKLSAFSIIGDTDTPSNTEIQIATNSGFTEVVNNYSGPYVLSFTATTNLALDTMHYVRARHKGTKWGWSAWSIVTSFKTLAASLTVPVISSPLNNGVDITVTPTITLAAPSVVGQTIAQMQVQVSTVNTFASTVWDSGARSYSQSVTVGATLAKGTKYFVRARLNGSITGWTAYSAVVAFTTASAAPADVWNFTSSTTFTVPVAGNYKIEVVGGGGKGRISYGGSCWLSPCQAVAGGGGGGYSVWQGALVKSTKYSVTVGGQSGSSSLGSLVSANGGAQGDTGVVTEGWGDGNDVICRSGYATGGAGGWGNTQSGGTGGQVFRNSSGCTTQSTNGGSGALGYGNGGGASLGYGSSDYPVNEDGYGGQSGLVRITLISY